MNYPVRNCTRYAVEENQRVKLFFELLNSTTTPLSDRTLEMLGEIMYGVHVGILIVDWGLQRRSYWLSW